MGFEYLDGFRCMQGIVQGESHAGELSRDDRDQYEGILLQDRNQFPERAV